MGLDQGRLEHAQARRFVRGSRTVFADPDDVLKSDASSPDRYLALGLSGLLRVPIVVHVEIGPRVRIISARKATHTERHRHEKSRNQA